MSSSTIIAERLRSEIPEAEDRLTRMRAALAVLDGSNIGAVTTTRVPEAITAPLSGLGPLSGSELARRCRVSHNTVLRHLQTLERDGQVARTGTRAQTRWHVA